MRVCITGVAGFIGAHLAQYHLDIGDEVIGIDNFSVKHSDHIQDLLQNPKFEFINVDLSIWTDYQSVLPGIDLIYHFAAVVGVFNVLKHPELVLNSNIIPLIHLMRAIQQYAPHARVFLASSSEVYGDNEHLQLREDMPVSIDMALKTRINYPVTKLVTEAYGLTYHELYHLNITILRIFNMIGKGQISHYGMVVPRFIEAAKKGVNLKVFGDGQQIRTFCDIKDFIGFISELINCKESFGRIVNIGGTEPIKILDLAKLIIKLSNSSSDIEFVSYEEAYHQHQDYVKHRCPDLSLLYSWVTYRHRFPLQTILEELISNEN